MPQERVSYKLTIAWRVSNNYWPTRTEFHKTLEEAEKRLAYFKSTFSRCVLRFKLRKIETLVGEIQHPRS